MSNLFLALVITIFMASNSYAMQSILTQAEGSACMEQDKSRQQIEEAALADAKVNAFQSALDYAKNISTDNETRSNILASYVNAQVIIVQELEKGWTSDASRDCYTIKMQTEVVPDEKEAAGNTRGVRIVDKWSGPLNLKVWTDKSEYQEKEQIRVHLQGNKPFYGRVVYKDASGKIIQLLPNPFRSENYFAGSGPYQIPADNDRFELEVESPFGEEEIVVYASSLPLGEIDIAPAGGVYEVKMAMADVGIRTRGFAGVRESVDKVAKADKIDKVELVAKADGAKMPKKENAGAATTLAAYSLPSKKIAAEFVEANVIIRTKQ